MRCTAAQKRLFNSLLYILSFGEPYQEAYDHLVEVPVTREQLNHYRNVAEAARSELAATLVKFESAQSEVRVCVFVTHKWALLASRGAKQSREVIRNRTKGHRFKLLGKFYSLFLLLCLKPLLASLVALW